MGGINPNSVIADHATDHMLLMHSGDLNIAVGTDGPRGIYQQIHHHLANPVVVTMNRLVVVLMRNRHRDLFFFELTLEQIHHAVNNRI